MSVVYYLMLVVALLMESTLAAVNISCPPSVVLASSLPTSYASTFAGAGVTNLTPSELLVVVTKVQHGDVTQARTTWVQNATYAVTFLRVNISTIDVFSSSTLYNYTVDPAYLGGNSTYYSSHIVADVNVLPAWPSVAS